MLEYLNEFYIIAIAHMFAVISPGPDFALIARQSFLYGRKVAIYTSIGIATGILVHIIYIILGFTVISTNEYIFNGIRICAGLYLFYLGLASFFSKKNIDLDDVNKQKTITKTNFIAYKEGLITNALNIKAILFFISLYASLTIDTPKITMFFYGLWMSLITCLWFIFLSYSFTNKTIKKISTKYYLYINKIMGSILIYIAIKIYLNY